MESPTSDDDDLASRLRGTHMGSGRYDFEIRFENRNSEDVHKDALAAAHAEHTRVREFALRAFELNELREQQLRLQQKNEQEAERVRLEELRAAEAIKARELENKARSIPKPPPRVPTPPPPAPSQVAASTEEQPKPATQPTSDAPKPATQSTPVAPRPQVPAPQPHPSTQASAPKPDPAQSNPLQQQLTLSPPVSQAQPQQKPTPVPQPQPTSPSNNSSLSNTHPDAERYLEVHRSLKQLRKFINDAGKANPALKKKTGEMRRAIRQSMGQLTGEKGANKEPVNRIVGILIESLETVPSPLVDPSIVMTSKPVPNEHAKHNGNMPALFIYLINHFAKAIVAQFIDEAGVRPQTADPIGVVAVTIFSKDVFLWRGVSLIDILIAKLRVVCPVLFGLRGNEKTEEGRARLGWRKEEGAWVQEQIHNTRMTGLGAGYAAICLRDFSRMPQLKHPWAPTHYWQTMASIISTPPDQTSPTQYMVLKAMIENYEEKFLMFYGNAAYAALQVALVHFPAQAPEQNVATRSLSVLADKLKRDMGLDLRADYARR